MIKKKTTKNFLLCTASALGLALLATATLLTGAFAKTPVAKAEEDNKIAAQVEGLQTWDDPKKLVVFFQYDEGYTTDYMTAEWTDGANDTYHWYLDAEGFGMSEEDKAKYAELSGMLAYEDKDRYNMPNAPLNKNLDAYNMGDYILIDGVPLKNYEYTLVANRFTRVHTLSIEMTEFSFATANEIVISAGCQFPTMMYSYFGEGEFSCLEQEGELVFTKRNGVWTRKYPFEGYEVGTQYDASEKFFYLRPEGSTYEGHVEAAASSFTDIFSRNNWGDDGYALASTADTVKGSLFVAELVNPIDAAEFGLIEVCFYSNLDRKLVSRNASAIEPGTLGPALEEFQVFAGFTTVTLMAPLYANENGQIDALVFEFLSDGLEDRTQNQFFLCSFSCGVITTPVYDESFSIQDKDDHYALTMRFNAFGSFTGEEALDLSKVSINGETLEEIGEYAEAEWAAVQGVYQINVRLNKAYSGEGQIRNPEYDYSNNKMSVAAGLQFPNGEVLDRDYTCHIYGWEKFVEYELLQNYKTIEVVSVTAFIDHNSADNLHFLITFDAQITSQIYYHACEREGWRASELPKYNLYDANFTNVYIAGGFKASLYENIVLNGRSIGQIHTEDDYTNCVFVQYGQTNLFTLDFNVDSNSDTYEEMYELYMSGKGVEIEVKKGMKFTTGYKTDKDAKYVLAGDSFYNADVKGEMKVFFDGHPVKDGDIFVVETTATKESISVEGLLEYTITESVEGNVKTFVVEGEGQKLTFKVEEKIVPLPEGESDDGCGSVVSGGLLSVFAVTSVCAAAVVLRKKNDEK